MDYLARPQRGLPIWLLLVGSLGAIVGFSWSSKDYVAAAAIGVIALCGLWGYCFGALRILGAVGGIAAAYHLAPHAASWMAVRLKDSISSSPWLTQTLSLGVAWLAIAAFTTCFTKILSRRWSENSERFQSGNQFLGFGLGAVQGAFGVLFLLSAAVTTAPLANERLRQPAAAGQEVLAHIVAQQIVEVADQTRHSTLASMVERYNPFEHVPQLKRMQHTLAAIQDPQVFARIADHPAMTKLQSKPSVRAAMESIANDPQLREIAMSGKPMNGQTALSLLDNPTIAKLLAEPELMREIAQALGEFDPSELKSLAVGPKGCGPNGRK